MSELHNSLNGVWSPEALVFHKRCDEFFCAEGGYCASVRLNLAQGQERPQGESD